MSTKVKTKKQLQKIADAVRLLHPDAKWMWITKIGTLHLSNFKPMEDETFGYIGINSDMVCGARIGLSMPVADTLIQLKGD